MKNGLLYFEAMLLLLFVPSAVGTPQRQSTVTPAGAVPERVARQAPRHAKTIPAPVKTSAQEAYGRLPLQFEENRGQTDARVKFLARGRGYLFFVTPQETVLSLRHATPVPERRDLHGGPWLQPAPPEEEAPATVLRFELARANPRPRIEGLELLPGISNYFIGNDPAKWHTKIPNYARVIERGIYPGIDAAYYGKEGHLESDFIVAPGQDPGVIRLKITGAQHLEINSAGDLVLSTEDGAVRLAKPILYQTVKGARREVEGGYRLLAENVIGFAAGPYDRRRPLVIDPTLVYSTYVGGSGASGDAANAIAVDANGNAYITGFTTSTDFPTANPHQGALGGAGAQNVFVTKLAANGSSLVFSTYLGGSVTDGGNGIALDSAGNPYVAGATSSRNFPVTDTSRLNGSQGAFVTKLSSSGSALMFSTYLSGDFSDSGNAIAVDAAGNAYVAGGTTSPGFPVTAGVFQGFLRGFQNAFVAKISSAGAVTWATYLGGEAGDMANGIGVDGANPANVFVAGQTTSTMFPTHLPIQANLAGSENAFVTELNPAGTMLVYSTYLGGSSDDQAFAIAAGPGGDAVVVGRSLSDDFPLVAPLQAHDQFVGDAFVTKVAAGGGSFVFSTVFGGPGGQTEAKAVALDPSGNIYIAGATGSDLLPTLDPLQGPAALGAGCECGPSQTGMVVEIKPDGSDYTFASYFGGASNQFRSFSSSNESIAGIAADPLGNVYVTGLAATTDFPIAGTFQSALKSAASNAFVAKISSSTPAGPQVFPHALSLETSALGFSTAVPNSHVTLVNGTNTLTITGITFTGPNAADFTETDSCGAELLPHAVCSIAIQATPKTATTETATLNITDSDTSSPQLVTLTVSVLSALTLNPSSVTGGAPATGTLTLGSPAPAGGLVFSLSSSIPSVAMVPASVTVPAGSATANFMITTAAVSFLTNVQISASSGTNAFRATLTVSPATGTLMVTPPTLPAFALQEKFTTSGTQNITLNNTGAVSIGVSVGATSGDFFASTGGSCPGSFVFTVAAGTSCTLAIAFRPTTAGFISAMLQVSGNFTGSPASVNVSGTGFQFAVLSPFFIVFSSSSTPPPQIVGTPSAIMFATLTNMSNTGNPMTLTGISASVSPAGMGYAIVSNACGATLAPGANCTIGLTYTPPVAGQTNATLLVTDSDPVSPQSIALFGYALNAQATLAPISPRSLSFGPEPIGVTKSGFISLQNLGNAPLAISESLMASGSNPAPADFTAMDSCAGVIPAGGFCTLTVNFAPSAAGIRTATVQISSGTPGAMGVPQSAALIGSGISPTTAAVAPTTVTFPSMLMGMPSAPQFTTFVNTGARPLLFTANSVLGGANPGDFSFTFPSGITGCGRDFMGAQYNPQVACPISFTFTPTATGLRTATLTIMNTASNSPQVVMLQGNGANGSANTIAPNPLAFGNQPVGTSSGAMTLMFSDTGTATLTITAFSTVGANAGDFKQVPGGGTCGPLPITVNVGANCTVQFMFSPAATGPEFATLMITDSTVSSPQPVTLMGTGTIPVVSLPPSVAFGNVAVSTPSSATVVTLMNTGLAPLTFTGAPNVTGPNAGDFAITGTTCVVGTPVAAGGSCTVTLVLTPKAAGAENATLNFADNATPPTQTVPLTGTGIVPTVTFTPAAGLNFGAVAPMAPSAPMSVTLQVAAGTGTLQLSSITIAAGTGTGPNDFAFAAGTTCPIAGGPVMGGSSCVVNIILTPSVAGNLSATLTFTGTNLVGSPVSIPLTGTGASTAAGFVLTPTTATGGNPTTSTILPGDTAMFTIVLQPNPGFIGMITLTCGTPLPPDTICAITPATINVTTSPSPPITVTITLRTNCTWVGPRQQGPGPGGGPVPVLLVCCGALALWLWRLTVAGRTFGAGASGRRWALQAAPALLLLVLVVLPLLGTGCASNPPPTIPGAPRTPSGVYPLQVIATAPGGVKQVLTFTVRVI